MKSGHSLLLVVLSLIVILSASSPTPAALASPLADTRLSHTIEQPERPIYDPLYDGDQVVWELGSLTMLPITAR